MDPTRTAACLEALGNPTRLAIFRLLVRAGDAGASVGVVQREIGIPASTLSHHIARLMRADLVTQERRSRQLVCRTNYEVMNGVLEYLTANCCMGISDDAEDAA